MKPILTLGLAITIAGAGLVATTRADEAAFGHPKKFPTQPAFPQAQAFPSAPTFPKAPAFPPSADPRADNAKPWKPRSYLDTPSPPAKPTGYVDMYGAPKTPKGYINTDVTPPPRRHRNGATPPGY